MSVSLIWFLIAAAFFGLELVVPGLILLFFGFGALLVSGTLLLLELDVAAQIWLFSASSVLSLIVLRKLFLKVFTGQTQESEEVGADSPVGGHAEVVEAIAASKHGRIKYRGSFWSATADESIAEGSMVEVIEVDGLHCRVRALS